MNTRTIRDGYQWIAFSMLTKIRVTPGGCWEWTAYRDGKGYGRWMSRRHPNMSGLAHRSLFECFNEIPDAATDLDHLCRNTSCVNPAHLEPVTHRENMLRSPNGASAVHFRQTHCIAGHPFDERNTYRLPKGGRMCRACNARRQRETKVRRLARGSS